MINTEINSFIEKINKNKIRVNQKNIKYHTISVFLDNDEFQITSLRNDLKTYGRSADVNFVDSVYIDAKRRDFTINALYLDYEGKKKSLKADGLLATCIQHEMDHLEGILFIDYLSKLKKSMIIKKLSKSKLSRIVV